MTDVSKVTLKVLAKFAVNLHEAAAKVDPDSSGERWMTLVTVATCIESALSTYDAAPRGRKETT
jgi:hypothetical protein